MDRAGDVALVVLDLLADVDEGDIVASVQLRVGLGRLQQFESALDLLDEFRT